METPELLMNCPESNVPDTAWTSSVFPRGSQSLEESTTMGSVLGSISASIIEILRMSDTVDFSRGGPELDSGSSLAVASALLNAGGERWEPPKVILVTVALCVMIGCSGEGFQHEPNHHNYTSENFKMPADHLLEELNSSK